MNEFEKARLWRLKRKLSVDELAELIGYARETIYGFERGLMAGRKIEPWVFQRYRRACEGLERELTTGRKFDW